LGIEVTPELVVAENPDAVVIATGATPQVPAIPGALEGKVVTAWDVLLGRVELGKRAVLVDQGDGDQECCSLAEFLADKGVKLEVITPSLFLGVELPALSVGPLYQRLLTKGVIITPLTRLRRISGSTVVGFNVYTDEEKAIENVDTVVLAGGRRACNELYRALKGRVRELYAVGDCVAPRRVDSAIREGDAVGRAL